MDQKLICVTRISALTLMSSTGTFDLFSFLQLYVISWNFELQRGFARIFVLILTFSFYEYFTEVLWAAFIRF